MTPTKEEGENIDYYAEHEGFYSKSMYSHKSSEFKLV